MSALTDGKDVGRRQTNVEGGRTKRYVVKVSSGESDALEILAREQRVTVSRLLVETALKGNDKSSEHAVGMTKTEKHNLMTELFALNRYAASCSLNINQIAKHSNQRSTFPRDAQELLLVAREVMVRIEEFLVEFAPHSRLAQSRREVAAKTVFLDKGWAEFHSGQSRDGEA
ncbi:hypothetical protein [Glaciibacter superstes]|uniref:hypothetical protein n=1 Tax=Glaciibacter superstes TaxID=501023 RepID=UPI0003B6E7BB|nr:hypothetical protein [Glaciibacter superstes]